MADRSSELHEEFRYAPSSRRRFAAFLQRFRRRELDPGTDPAPPERVDADTRRTYLRRHTAWLWPVRWRIVWVILLGVVVAGGDACLPVVSGWMIDLLNSDERGSVPDWFADWSAREAFLLLAAGALLVILATRLIGLGRGYLQAALTAELTQRLRRQLFKRLVHLPLGDLNELKTGGIQSRLSGDVDQTTGLVQQAVVSPASAVLRLLIVLAVLVTIDWQITLAALTLLAICGWIYYRFMVRIRPVHRMMRKQRAEIDGRLNEVFGGIRVVRSFARAAREQLQYGVGHHTVMREGIWLQFHQQVLFFFWEVLLPLSGLIILTLGGFMVFSGRLSIGEVIAMQLLSIQVLTPVLQIVRSATETQRGLASMERIYDLLDKEEEFPDPPSAGLAPSTIDTIRFEAVSFGYQSERPVLQDIDLTIPGGSTVALVGVSGAGKTTLTSLLARFEDPDTGRITVNGIDLRDIRLASWRGLLGFVQQEVFLFDGTIRDNIAYGRRDADDAAVIAAARAANAWEFIEPLERGLDSRIGERGIKLSGGQRQRLAIARAMLADPAILILDEATSNLDTESESLIQESLERLLAGRTTLIIAHRLNTIRHADRIVVMESGRIVECGAHDELMAAGGVYRRMVEQQTADMLAG